MNPNFVQAVILCCSIVSCVLQTFTNFKLKRIAFATTICAQPFWFYTAHSKGQWGIMLLAFLFAFMAMRGLWTHRPRKGKPMFQVETKLGVIPIEKRGKLPILFKKSVDKP